MGRAGCQWNRIYIWLVATSSWNGIVLCFLVDPYSNHLAFLVYVTQSKHAVLIAARIKLFISKRVLGKLKTISFDMDEMDEDVDEDEIAFGVGKVEDVDQRQMLDFYACVECGRCTDVCPAATSGKMLSPMDIM